MAWMTSDNDGFCLAINADFALKVLIVSPPTSEIAIPIINSPPNWG